MKKLFKILGIVIVLLIAALIVLPIVFKDDIVKIVKEAANDNLNAKVDFGNFDLSLISSFPNFKFIISDVKVEGINQFEGTTLASIKTLETTIDMMGLINGGKINIKTFQIIEPNINVIVLKDSTANYDIAKATDEAPAEEVEKSGDTKFKIGIQYYAIKNANITYDDQTSGMYAKIKNLTHEGNGDFTQDIFILNTLTTIDEVTYKDRGIKLVNKMNIELKFDAEIDMPNSKYTFKENSFRFNKLTIGLDGWVAMPNENDIEMDIEFKTNQTEFKSLLSMVPTVYLTDFETVKTAGSLSLNGYAKGTYNDPKLPAFGLNLSVDNAMFKYPDLPSSVDNIGIDLKITNPGGSDDNTIVDLSKFHLEMGDNPVDMRALISTPVSDANIDASIKMQMDLASIKDFIPTEGEEYKGNITMDVNMKGRASSIEKEEYDKFYAEGKLIVLDVLYKSPDLNYDVDIKSMYMDFSPTHLALTSFESKIGNSDISANGRINNIVPYYFNNQPLSGTFNVSSNLLDLNEFMTEEDSATIATNEAIAAADTTVLEVFDVPANIDFVMTAAFKKMLYDKIEITDVKGLITIKDKIIKMDNLSMNLLDGSMVMNGDYNSQGKLPKVDYSYAIKRFDLPKTFAAFNTVESLVPIAKNATGKFSTDLVFTATLDKKMEPILNSIDGKGSMLTENITIKSSGVLTKIADALKNDKLRELDVNNAKIDFEIKDGRVYVQPFDIKISDSKATVSGSHGFDETMDYVMRMDVSMKEFGGAGNKALSGLMGLANAKGANLSVPERIKVNVFITGTSDDPKIKVGFKDAVGGATGSAKEAVKEKVKEVIEEKKEEIKEDVKAKAKEQANKILADAQKEADRLKATAAEAAKKLKEEGYKEADKLIKDAGRNPIKKVAAKLAAKKIKEQSDKKAAVVNTEADKKAKSIMDAARKKADDLTK